jgi:hypothetical protein
MPFFSDNSSLHAGSVPGSIIPPIDKSREIRSWIEQIRLYIATPFGEDLNGNSVTVVSSAGSIPRGECFLRIFRVEANRTMFSE